MKNGRMIMYFQLGRIWEEVIMVCFKAQSLNPSEHLTTAGHMKCTVNFRSGVWRRRVHIMYYANTAGGQF
jgi:hypothetical protein